MKIQKIVERAVTMIGENCPAADEVYEKAPYILGTFLYEHSNYHKHYADLGDSSPVTGKLADAAAKYLCAMLLIDDDPDASDTFYNAYCDVMCSIH